MKTNNILIDALPDTLCVAGSEYKIKTDFRTWIRFTLIISSDKGISKKMVEIIKLVYCSLPPNLNEAVKKAMWFYNPPKLVTNATKKANNRRVYDFEYDADKIYAAFMQQYGIDLSIAHLHWWQFKAYFDNLAEDTRFMQAIKYRNINLSEIKDKEQRKYYSEMQKMYALPDNRTDEEKEQSFVKSLTVMF